MKVVIRDRNPLEDDAFIYSSWTKTACFSQNPRPHPFQKWHREKCQEIKNHLETGNTQIACIADNPDFILGYVVRSNDEIKWLYVRKQYQNQGIEQLLNPKEKNHGTTEDAR